MEEGKGKALQKQQERKRKDSQLERIPSILVFGSLVSQPEKDRDWTGPRPIRTANSQDRKRPKTTNSQDRKRPKTAVWSSVLHNLGI